MTTKVRVRSTINGYEALDGWYIEWRTGMFGYIRTYDHRDVLRVNNAQGDVTGDLVERELERFRERHG